MSANLIKFFFQTIAGNVILFLSARGVRVFKMASAQGQSFGYSVGEDEFC
jgi:hypothetical protein